MIAALTVSWCVPLSHEGPMRLSAERRSSSLYCRPTVRSHRGADLLPLHRAAWQHAWQCVAVRTAASAFCAADSGRAGAGAPAASRAPCRPPPADPPAEHSPPTERVHTPCHSAREETQPSARAQAPALTLTPALREAAHAPQREGPRSRASVSFALALSSSSRWRCSSRCASCNCACRTERLFRFASCAVYVGTP